MEKDKQLLIFRLWRKREKAMKLLLETHKQLELARNAFRRLATNAPGK